ncbi:MAG: hypothetical protein ACREFY_07820 [Acetobacteraceae bacterium]
MSARPPSAGAFRSLLDAVARVRVPLSEAGTAASDTANQLRRDLRAAIHTHVTDARWREFMHRMREAAEDGAKEYRLLRFPFSDCTDDGRAIREAEPQWPTTLTGDAAALYRHWEQELKPLGFHIDARELDYPGGLPGDIGLFIAWG